MFYIPTSLRDQSYFHNKISQIMLLVKFLNALFLEFQIIFNVTSKLSILTSIFSFSARHFGDLMN